jgi:hypothetical protein
VLGADGAASAPGFLPQPPTAQFSHLGGHFDREQPRWQGFGGSEGDLQVDRPIALLAQPLTEVKLLSCLVKDMGGHMEPREPVHAGYSEGAEHVQIKVGQICQP